MDDIFRIMCDVAELATRGSDAARMEAERTAAERARRAATSVVVTADIVAPRRRARWSDFHKSPVDIKA